MIAFFDAGGGHRSAANALTEIVAREQRPWDVQLLNLQEHLDAIDPFLHHTGIRLQDIYNRMLTCGWTLGATQLLPALQGLIRLYHGKIISRLTEYWKAEKPDMVISVIPHFNLALVRSVHAARAETPFVTLLTDLADYPPHFWMEPESQYLICGSHRALQQALSMGHPQERVFRTSGMILHPRFYDFAPLDRRAERQRLGLDPDLPTGLVLFGGLGAPVMLDIAHSLDRCRAACQFLFLCGHNQNLANKISARKWKKKIVVEGFTLQVPYYMQLSDFFVGKPGPGSISEAVHFHLPVIVEKNAWTLPQERYNAEWILEHGAGLVTRSFRNIGDLVSGMLADQTLEQLKSNAARIENRAIFEVPGILERIARQGSQGAEQPLVSSSQPVSE